MKTMFFLMMSSFLGAGSFAKETCPKSTPELLAKGKTSYSTNCMTCHGDKGDGNGPAGALLNPKPRNFMKDRFKKGESLEAIYKTVTEGLPGTSMVAWGHLPQDERCALAHYVVSLKKSGKH